jgi:hypothetical protein
LRAEDSLPMTTTTKRTVRCLLLGLMLVAVGASAQQRTMYRCTVDGKTAWSDRPCAAGAPALGSIGPERESRSAGMTSMPMVPKAANYIEYLSPLCAELNEGMRNGPARGLGARALYELHSSYRERCSDDDQAARKRFAEEQAKRREAANNEQMAEKRERDMIKVSREQCDEMYRIVHTRRKKLDTMTPGERADFDRFEANWKSRCRAA